MSSRRARRETSFIFIVLSLIWLVCPRSQAQAALFMEKTAGISTILNPTGHNAFYFARICAATPMKLRRCGPGELGTVIARYKGIGGYDWLAMPLLPYLYSVESPSEVPARADHATVERMRRQYNDAHQLGLGKDVPEGGRIGRGWNQLMGATYERGIYVFRFQTTEEQDEAFIARMNAAENRSRFSLLFRNCADFAAGILNFNFPYAHAFGRRRPAEAGLVTPRQIAYELARYARSHPETQLTVMEVPQIPGYRRPSRTDQGVSASLIVTGYAIPLAVFAPYAAAAVAADYLAWGRYPISLRHARILTPKNVSLLASPVS